MNVPKSICTLFSTDTSKDSLYGITGQGVAAIAGFVFYAVASNVVALQEIGYFSLALATAAIIKDIIDPALNATLVAFIAQGSTAAQAITRYVVRIKLLYFGIILGIGFLLPNFFSRIVFNTDWAFLLIMTLVTSATLSLGSMISGFLQGHRKFLLDSLFVSLQPLVRLVFLGGAIYFSYVGVIELLTVNVLAYLVVIGLFGSVITIEYLTGDVNTETKQSANRMIRPLTLATITGVLTDRVGLYITNFLLGPSQVGILAIVMQLFMPAKQIAGVLNTVFGTRYASFTKKIQSVKYTKKALVMIVPIAFGALCTMPIAPLILGIFGEQYVSGTLVLRIITLGYIGFLFQVPFVAQLLYFKKRTDVLFWISILQFGLTVTLQWIFISMWGLTGAAIGITLTLVMTASSYAISTLLLPVKDNQ